MQLHHLDSQTSMTDPLQGFNTIFTLWPPKPLLKQKFHLFPGPTIFKSQDVRHVLFAGDNLNNEVILFLTVVLLPRAIQCFLSSGFFMTGECYPGNLEISCLVFRQNPWCSHRWQGERRRSKLCCATVITTTNFPMLNIKEEKSMIPPPLLHL